MTNKEKLTGNNRIDSVSLVDVFFDFVSPYQYKPFPKPFKDGDKIFATDSHSLIYTNADNYDGFFVENSTTPDCKKFITNGDRYEQMPVVDLRIFNTEDPFISMYGKIFMGLEIERLYVTAKKLKEKIHLLDIGGEYAGSTFRIGVVSVMIMPCVNVDIDDVVLDITPSRGTS